MGLGILFGFAFCLVFFGVGLVLVVGCLFFFPFPRKEQSYPVRKPLEETMFGILQDSSFLPSMC